VIRAEGQAVSVDDRRATERLFHRDLPGGGYVAIEMAPISPASDRLVRVIVERRSDRLRRVGHTPPTLIEQRWISATGMGDLYRFACDNVAIANKLLTLARAD
jgi:hypothetical protein